MHWILARPSPNCDKLIELFKVDPLIKTERILEELKIMRQIVCYRVDDLLSGCIHDDQAFHGAARDNGNCREIILPASSTEDVPSEHHGGKEPSAEWHDGNS